MRAAEKFVAWLACHEHRDEKSGRIYRYHPRSDAHSMALARFLVEDLLCACPALAQQARAGQVVYGVNVT